jgi:hypothetical protein
VYWKLRDGGETVSVGGAAATVSVTPIESGLFDAPADVICTVPE